MKFSTVGNLLVLTLTCCLEPPVVPCTEFPFTAQKSLRLAGHHLVGKVMEDMGLLVQLQYS